MSNDDNPLTPKERLALSRAALLTQLSGKPHPDKQEPTGAEKLRSTPFLDKFAWTGVARRIAEHWWRRHPANAVGQLVRPVIELYARQQPYKLLAVAGAVGAVAMLVKPWRLLSMTALLTTAFKTSDLADMVNTLMRDKTSIPKE